MFRMRKSRKYKLIAKRVVESILLRLQILLLSASGYVFIEGFNLIEKSVVYIPLGFLCIVGVLFAISPIPTERELRGLEVELEDFISEERMD